MVRCSPPDMSTSAYHFIHAYESAVALAPPPISSENSSMTEGQIGFLYATDPALVTYWHAHSQPIVMKVINYLNMIIERSLGVDAIPNAHERADQLMAFRQAMQKAAEDYNKVRL